jgi:hypothetical protein
LSLPEAGRERIMSGPGAADSLVQREEVTQMDRGRSAVIVIAILLASAGSAAVIIWQAKAHGIPLFYVLGTLMVVIGIGFSALHLSVSDEYLRQHFGGEENATRMRQMWKRGWVGVLLGVAIIAAQCFLGGGQ